MRKLVNYGKFYFFGKIRNVPKINFKMGKNFCEIVKSNNLITNKDNSSRNNRHFAAIVWIL